MQKKDLIEFFLMLISSDAEKDKFKQVQFNGSCFLCIIEFSLRFISSDVEKHIFDVCLMLISSSEKKKKTAIIVFSLRLT